MGWQDAPPVEGNQKWMQAPAVDAPAPAAAPPEQEASFLDKFLGAQGTRYVMGPPSMAAALAQMGAHGLDSVAGTNVSPYIDQPINAYEAAKQRGMKALGNEGTDFMGMLGSMGPAGAISKGVTKALPEATGLVGKTVTGGIGGAVGGAAIGATAPVVNSQDY